MILRILTLVLIYVCFTTCDKEYAHHSQNHYHNGVHNEDYDKNVLLESLGLTEDFSKMSVDEAKERVSKHMKKIDVDRNGLISKQEISACIFDYFQQVDEKEAQEKLLDIDENKNNHVEWEEYLKKVYNYEVHEIEEFKKDTSAEMKNFLEIVFDDTARFKAADLNGDEKLDSKEYGAFLHPSSYEYMHDYEIDLTLSQIDRNRDGFVTFDEYLGDSTPSAEQRIVDHENFLSYDSNLDGKLDRDEIQIWLLPDKKTLAEEEAEHLIEETDANDDRQLSIQEIVDKYDIWSGSAATHYGDGLKLDHSEL